MSDDGIPAIRPSGDLRRLFEVPFSTLFANPASLEGLVERYVASNFCAIAGLAETATMTGANLRSSLRVVYSEATLKGLRTGKYHFALDAKTGLQSAVPSDAASRIVEHPKFDHVRSLANCAVFGAALLASVETERQLVAINRKLDRLIDFAETEREGRLRGAYDSLARISAMSDRARRADRLDAALENLHELSGIFFESSIRTLARIQNPEGKRLLEDIFSWPPAERRELEGRLASAWLDFRRVRLCWFLQRLIVSELDDPSELRMLVKHHLGGLIEIKESLVGKLRYLDPQGAADLCGQLNRALDAHEEEMNQLAVAIDSTAELSILRRETQGDID